MILIACWTIAGLLGFWSGDQGETIQLPSPRFERTVALEECIARRRSVRSFENRGLTVEEIGQILWATQGITDRRRRLRSAPSAGALYPLEIFVVLREGTYHYNPYKHVLSRTVPGDMRGALQDAALDQESVGNAPAVFVIAAVFERTEVKYGERTARYVHMEAGHACQNLLLQATALGLGGVPVGAFRDVEVTRRLGLEKNVRPLYLAPVGHPAPDAEQRGE